MRLFQMREISKDFLSEDQLKKWTGNVNKSIMCRKERRSKKKVNMKSITLNYYIESVTIFKCSPSYV